MQQTAIIIGAGPAGLTAAFELLQRTGIVPIVLEAEDYVGGISRTANYKGNRIDIGGHRFFSKSDRVMEWWLDRMPIEQLRPGQATISYQRKSRDVANGRRGARPGEVRPCHALAAAKEPHLFPPQVFRLSDHAEPRHDQEARPAADHEDRFQLRPRGPLSFPAGEEPGRVLHQPLRPRIVSHVLQVVHGEGLGRALLGDQRRMGAQRVKGLSILGTLKHIFGKLFRRRGDIAQKGTETSLIEQFLYPKHGPGQMWETVSREIVERGGQIVHHQRVRKIHLDGERDRGRRSRRSPQRPGHRLSRRLVLLDHAR